MRKLAQVVVVALALAGCKHAGSEKLEGTWQGTRADGVPAGTEAAANEFAKKTTITAHGDEITVSTPGSPGTPDKYVVDSKDASKIVIHTEKDGLKAQETFTFSPDGKTMVWKVDDGRTITFTKKSD